MALVVGEAKGSTGKDFGWSGYVHWRCKALMCAAIAGGGPCVGSEGRQGYGVKAARGEECDSDVTASAILDGCGGYSKTGEEYCQR